MKSASWKTTITGLVSAIAINLYPIIEGEGFNADKILIGVALAVLGYLAKDFNVSGK
jgi:hypothetical protein